MNFFKKYTLNPKKFPDKKDISHFLYILIVPIYLILFFITEAVITENYFVCYLPLDDIIPFCEWFLIPYYLWYPFMLVIGVYLLLKDAQGFKKFMSFIGISFCAAIVIFLVFPNGQNLRPAQFPRDNIFTRLISGLYTADTNTNVCPSLHVVGSLAVPFAAMHNKTLSRPAILIPTYLFAGLISISTMFIKQHSVVDVIVAIPYSIIVYLLVYKVIFKPQNSKK